MAMYKCIFSLCFFLGLNFNIYGQSSEDLLNKAQVSFQAKKYDQSINTYHELIKQGYNSEDLHFNLATAYYKSGNLPHAVLYYEKVLKANPYNNDARTNLSIVNDERASEFSSIPDFFITEWWRNFSGFFGPGLWSMLGLMSIFFSLYFFYNWLMVKPIFRNLVSSILMICMGLLFLMAARTSNKLRYQTSHLINIKGAKIYSSMDNKSEAIEELIPGEKLKILDKVGEWYQVMLINKEQGWIMSDGLEEI